MLSRPPHACSQYAATAFKTNVDLMHRLKGDSDYTVKVKLFYTDPEEAGFLARLDPQLNIQLVTFADNSRSILCVDAMSILDQVMLCRYVSASLSKQQLDDSASQRGMSTANLLCHQWLMKGTIFGPRCHPANYSSLMLLTVSEMLHRI